MTSSVRRASFCLAIAALLSPTGDLPQALDESEGSEYMVENNTDRTLRCTFRRMPEPWGAYFTLAPGDEFAPSQIRGNESVYFSCAPPVVRRAWRLRLGQRYSLLERTPGEVRLFRIDPDAG